MNDMRNKPPGPTNWVNSPVVRSSGSSGGKPPETTTVSERAMNSIPSVAMKLGMAKVNGNKAVHEADRGGDQETEQIAARGGPRR